MKSTISTPVTIARFRVSYIDGESVEENYLFFGSPTLMAMLDAYKRVYGDMITRVGLLNWWRDTLVFDIRNENLMCSMDDLIIDKAHEAFNFLCAIID